jgi:hypothetical protein
MLKYALFPAVPRSRRRKIHPLAAIALFGSMMLLAVLALGSITSSASAAPDCNGPNPPPICDGGPDEDPEPELSLTASSPIHGTTAINSGQPMKLRYASYGALSLNSTLTGVSWDRSAILTVTESWQCGYSGAPTGQSGSVTTTAVGAHTVADPELRCPTGLYGAQVQVVAHDPEGELPPTGELYISVLGTHSPESQREQLLPSPYGMGEPW